MPIFCAFRPKAEVNLVFDADDEPLDDDEENKEGDDIQKQLEMAEAGPKIEQRTGVITHEMRVKDKAKETFKNQGYEL